ncbi:peptidase inhibitor family I36 protein [Streptomyces sp. NRRL F-4474]|uniref:peptidase inhibitor family I36 protein n=1 Tax=Streptomyces sp. NRRL F-4474 TaxID=1463851 RepID=UPI00099BAE2B|nr:peptidase inhibitor family I36 protein [Streptomyces sp. NRRL F-4474]
MRSLRVAIGTGAALGAIIITAPAANATTPAPTTVAPSAGVLSPAADEQARKEAQTSKPIFATYKGKRINLTEGWQGAQICVETLNLEVKCFDNQAEADASLVKDNAAVAKKATEEARKLGVKAAQEAPASVRAASDCGYGWVCIWQDINYTGRKLQWSASGHKKFADWDFRDKATSICVARPTYGATLIDYRDFMVDPTMSIGATNCHNLTNISYVHGGTWNDKADAMDM